MGIESVQPKGISIPQMVGEVIPAATPSAVAQLADAFRQGFITSNDIMEHTGGNALARGLIEKKKMAAEQQLLGEQMDPLAIEARQETTRLAGAKAKGERETALTKDFVGAYLKYNLPLKKADGTPDYSGMAEVGQKYADMERTLAYAKAGMTGTPVKRIDPKTGQEYTVSVNAYGEDVTDSPGQKNQALDHYRKLFRKASAFLIQNDNEPSLVEGKEPPIISVSPKALQDEAAAPTITSLHPEITTPPPVSPTAAVIERATRGITPLAGIAAPIAGLPSSGQVDMGGPVSAFNTPAPKVVVEPTATGTAVTVQAPQLPQAEKPVVEVPTYTPGTGVLTGMGDFKPEEALKEARSTELYKNWAEKSGSIASFRNLVSTYKSMKPGAVTTQTDLALANAAMQISSMSAAGGSPRGMGQELKRIEESIPVVERILDLPDIVLQRDKFPEGVRERLIQVTEQKAQEIERLAGDVIKTTGARLTARGVDPTAYLFGAEQGLLTGAAAGAAATGAGKTVTLKSGRRVVIQ